MKRTPGRLVAALILLSLVAPLNASARTSSAAEVDVLVVGGTPAGLAAALSAARRGERVTLVSATADLGGAMTDAMMDQWDLNLAPGGASVEHGIFDEIYTRLGDVFTAGDADRELAAFAASAPNITVRYDASLVSVATTPAIDGEKRVDAATFDDGHTGRTFTVAAPYVIDATDDGDLAAMAGARYDVGRQDTGIDERTQAVTEMFTLDGVDWPELANTYDTTRDGAGGVLGPRAWGYAKVMNAYRATSSDIVVRDLNLGLEPRGDVTVNAIDVCNVDGLDANDLVRAKAETEREAPRLLDYLRQRVPGFARARVGIFAPAVYVRETRHIAGLERLTAADVWDGRIPADSIGLASYPIDLHPVTPEDEPAYAPQRHVYGIPFGALVPAGFVNVLLASPAISASHEAAGSARTIPTTIEEGEADGLAVAIALHRNCGLTSAAETSAMVADQRHARSA